MPVLTTTRTGTGTGIPLIIAHGLFGSARNWRGIARILGRTRPIVTVDMRNHGQSFHAESHLYPDMAEDLLDTISEASDGVVDLLGHSMGGKASMWLALHQPDVLRRLIVADIAPVAYTHSHADHVDAMLALDLRGIGTRRDADEALAEHIAEPAIRAFLLQSLALDTHGPRWRLNLDALGRNMAGLVGFPRTTATSDLETLFLTGAESDYVKHHHRNEILTRFPKATFDTIPGAGHWLHADQPEKFTTAVESFLGAT